MKMNLMRRNSVMNRFTKEMFESIYNEMGSQKLLEIESAVKVYYGKSNDGNPRLSFMSSVAPPKMDSTKMLKVIQGKEMEGVYWTNFDLLQANAKQVFYSFCSDLVSAIERISEEKKALVILKNRFHIWKSMFKKGGVSISAELLKGLFGELYFLHTSLTDKYDVNEAVAAWSGANGTAKDFSIGTDWYEIKTVSSSAVSVKISSVSQLTSDIPGYLVIIKIESMSPVYSNEKSSIGELLQAILERIDIDETKESFLGKLAEYGLDLIDEYCSEKYNVVSQHFYIVDDKFPRILESDVKIQEICKVSYELIISSLDRFKEG
jgi:hypothetical protein